MHNLMSQIYRAKKCNMKSSSTKDLFGIENELCRNRIEFRMNAGINCKNFQVDLVKPTSSFDVSNDEEMHSIG